MIDRRILLASIASLLGLAAFRWLRTSPAQAAEKFEIEKTDAEWRAQLTPQQYEILRQQGTERPGSSPLLKEHRKGIFACAGCDLPLFSSETKFESGTGWPSFYQPLDNAVGTTRTAPSECCGPKCIAAAAAAISATSSTTGRSRPACATAWTALRWYFIRRHRRRAEPVFPGHHPFRISPRPGNCCPPGNCAPVLGPGLFHLCI